MDLLPALGQIQDKFGYLPKEELSALAEENELSLADVIGRASFYAFFSFAPGGSTGQIEKRYPCRKTGILLNAPKNYTWMALAKAKAVPDTVIPMIKEAGLLGRSGGGFPVWTKWETVRDADSDVKYVVCNADEGEPGTGKDRVLIECNPNSVIEGMAVCAAVIGAKKGYIYLRGEYADLKEILEEAIQCAPLGGLELEVRMGHGAYVCGEETSLLNSLEGKRGETRLKPPYPGVAGLWNKPTVVNNVESFACVPFILEFGAENFRRHGVRDYPGTKLYTVCGAVKKPGVYELEAGATVGELLAAAGGGEKPLKAVLVGGGSGSILDMNCLDMPMTPKACALRGASFGTASLRFIAGDEKLTVVVRELTEFFARESCGTCVPCRIGLRRLASLLKKLESGETDLEDRDELQALARHIQDNARCGLGQAAVTPVLSLIKNFPEVLK